MPPPPSPPPHTPRPVARVRVRFPLRRSCASGRARARCATCRRARPTASTASSPRATSPRCTTRTLGARLGCDSDEASQTAIDACVAHLALAVRWFY
eukprot:553539-Pleurochrysis_carterae.AAC.1